MSEFWYTAYTMQKTYGEGYQAFSLFDGVHLFWLVLCCIVCILGCALFQKASVQLRKKVLLGLSIAIIGIEAGRQAVILLTGQWQVETLPLHLCSINMVVCLWYSLRPNRLAGNILYALCLPGAIVALLSPSWLSLPMWNFCHIDSELFHILLVLYPLLLLTDGFRPEIRVLPKVIGCLLGLCVVIYPFNKVFGTNFMFLNDPDGNAITSICASIFGDQYYLIGFVWILLILFGALYLPFFIADIRRNRKAAGLK